MMATETELNMTELIVGQEEEEQKECEAIPNAEQAKDKQLAAGATPQWATAWCWEWGNTEGVPQNEKKMVKKIGVDDAVEEEITMYCNVPQLQYLYHFANASKFNEDSYVKMTVIDINVNDGDKEYQYQYQSGPPPLDIDGVAATEKWIKLARIPELYRLVKYPSKSWEVIEDGLNAMTQFEAIDKDKNKLLSKTEFTKFWKAQGLKDEDIDKKLNAFDTADIDENGIDFNEFKDSLFNLNDKCCNDDFKIRMSRWAFVVVIPVLSLIILSVDDTISISLVIGASIQIMYLIYFATLGYYFFQASKVSDGTVSDAQKERDDAYLYRVFSRPGSAVISKGKWAPLSMTINQVAWPLKCVHSVSEFSAVDGAIPAVMLANIGTYTWTMVTVHFMTHAHTRFEWQLSDFLEIIGVAGLVMLGVFEADPYNPSVTKTHMIGAFMGFGTVIGYIAQNIERSGANDEAADSALDAGGLDSDPWSGWNSWADEEINDGEASIRTSLSWLLFILFIVFYTLWQVTLAICYFQEGEAWGIYAEDISKRGLEDTADSEKCCCDKCENTWWCTCITICCGCFTIITAVPLLFILCMAPCYLCGVAKHKKAVKKKTNNDLAAERKLMDFQPCLPDWKNRVTADTKKTITAFSSANVLFEGIVLLVGSTALSLWLMGYDTYCDGPCPEQMVIFILLLIVLAFGVIAVYFLFGFCGSDKFGEGTLDKLCECKHVKICCCNC